MMKLNEEIKWQSPNGDVAIIVRNIGTVIQVIEQSLIGPGIEIEPYENSPYGEFEARAVARMKAEVITYNQTGEM